MANIGLVKKYSTIADYWTDVQSFMTSTGWTLHDDIDSNNKVYKTNGSSSNYPYIYVKLTNNTTDRVSMVLYLYWNATTHVGTVNAYYSASYNYCKYDSTYEMGLTGNADCVSLVNYADTAGIIFGYFDQVFYPEVTTTSGAVSTGTYVDLPVVDSSDFIAGQHIQIVGVDYEGRDTLTIAGVSDSGHINVENLPRDYASGAFVGTTPCPAGSTTYSSKHNFCLLCNRRFVGTANGSSSYYDILSSPITYNYTDPDQATNLYGLTPLHGSESSDHITGWFDLGDLYKYSMNATIGDVFAVLEGGNQPEQGAVTSVTSTTLYDAGKSWGVDVLAGRFVVIVDGTGVGQVRKILSNTANTLTVVAWGINPSVSSIYRFCDKVYRYWNSNLAFLEDREVL